MQLAAPAAPPTRMPSSAAKRRMEAAERRPLFLADWIRAVFIHYEVEPAVLQKHVPFPLHLRNGHAYVSLVAFTMQKLRFAFAQRLSQWLLRPISDHGFLNVRTYVQTPNDAGIYFLAEWLSSRLSVPLGPVAFGLPYRFGKLRYWHGRDDVSGEVLSAGSNERLSYRAEIDPDATFSPCIEGSLDEFLMERYTAFTRWRNRSRFFRVWHQPWPQVSLPHIRIGECTLFRTTGAWAEHAELIGANFSTGAYGVWMGRPHRLQTRL